jgi:hypothetical protein
MPNNAFYIVEEFLRSNDAQSRKNALTALALMDDDKESIGRLGEVALADADEGVRRRAVEEIVSLPEAALPSALKVLRKGLSDESNGQKAYAALGHLKSLGKELPEDIPLSLLSRLKLAWAMSFFLYPVRNNLAYRARVWKPTLIGATIFVALLGFFYARQVKWGQEDYFVYLILMILLCVLTCFFVTQRTTPINLYLDRKMGSLVEIATSVVLSLNASIILFLIYLLGSYNSDWALFTVVLALPVAVGVTRAATLLSFGVIQRRRPNIALQVCVAVATAFLLLTAFNFYIWQSQPVVKTALEQHISRYDPDGDGPQPVQVSSYPIGGEVKPEYRAVQALWGCLLPLIGVMALAFASIDKKSPPVQPIAGRAGVAFSAITVGLAIALLATILTVGRTNNTRAVNINDTFEGLKKLSEVRVDK